MKVRLFKSKNLLQYLFILTLLSLGGYLTYAQFTSDAYVIRTINVFPASIEAPGWKNAETLTFQNLDTYALTQEFNTINSAYLDPAWRQAEIETKVDRDPAPADNAALPPDRVTDGETIQTEVGSINDSLIPDASAEAATAGNDAAVAPIDTQSESMSPVETSTGTEIQEADTSATQPGDVSVTSEAPPVIPADD